MHIFPHPPILHKLYHKIGILKMFLKKDKNSHGNKPWLINNLSHTLSKIIKISSEHLQGTIIVLSECRLKIR